MNKLSFLLFFCFILISAQELDYEDDLLLDEDILEVPTDYGITSNIDITKRVSYNENDYPIEETTFINSKNNIINAFKFKNIVCDSKVISKEWKNYIILHGGKVNGGTINKAKGDNFKFTRDGEPWTSHFTYGYNEDNVQEQTMELMVYFIDQYGSSLSYKYSPDEAEKAKQSIIGFNHEIRKACVNNELKLARIYLLDLNKKKSELDKRINQLDRNNIDIEAMIEDIDEENLSEKQAKNLENRRIKLNKNQSLIEKHRSEISDIESIIPSQQKVISSFEEDLKDLL